MKKILLLFMFLTGTRSVLGMSRIVVCLGALRSKTSSISDHLCAHRFVISNHEPFKKHKYHWNTNNKSYFNEHTNAGGQYSFFNQKNSHRRQFFSQSNRAPGWLEKYGFKSFFGMGLLALAGTYIQHTQEDKPQEDNDQPIKKKIILGDRPPQVQAYVDQAFEHNKNTEGRWLHNGSWGFYGLLGIGEELILKQLTQENPEKQDVYIMDVGCASGGWGREVMALLQDPVYKNSGKTFHIFNITGSNECDEFIKKDGNITLYQFNQFKIENIDEEFAKRGFDLNDKVDLIVSHWTLRHLVDPFGTLKRMYGMLTPQQGTLLSNGFLFMLNDSEKVQAFPLKNENILGNNTHTSVPFGAITAGRDTGQFLLKRNNNGELELPLEYTNNVHHINSYSFQCSSGVVTVFNKGDLIKPVSYIDRDYIAQGKDNQLYCCKDDLPCKRLYNSLAKQELFYRKSNNH